MEASGLSSNCTEIKCGKWILGRDFAFRACPALGGTRACVGCGVVAPAPLGQGGRGGYQLRGAERVLFPWYTKGSGVSGSSVGRGRPSHFPLGPVPLPDVSRFHLPVR